LKDVIHRTTQPTEKYTILSLKNKLENMLRYKIQIKIFVPNAMSEGCSSAVYITSPSM
jgi:hypothetical protein